MKSLQILSENIRISINAIRSNSLRTVLTIIIIAFGIMALVGILTAIDAIKGSIRSEFASLGANSFSIVNRKESFSLNNNDATWYKHISYREAQAFKDRYKFPARLSVYIWGTGRATVRYQSEKTNPNISILGSDENYLSMNGKELAEGRNFTPIELQNGRQVVILGHNVAQSLFPKESAMEEMVRIGSASFKVIGVLAKQGSSFGAAGDNSCILPITSVRQYFPRPNMNYTLQIEPVNPELQKSAINEAEGIFRIIRNIAPGKESNFGVETSDALSATFIDSLGKVTLATTLIGVITLFGAAIGLMNIMLVSVTERTREIGIRKAIGANARVIRQQFLWEAVIIGQLGGLLGIVLGIFMGNIVSLFTGGDFIIPWLWIIGGVFLCFCVSVASGIFPAIKAARLDPIIALRYE